MQRILVVEDEPSLIDIISLALENESFQVQACMTGSDALHELKQFPYQLIILDIGLPDMNGFELARLIHQDSAIPLIFLTARDDEIDRVVGLELGADDYVTKPFSPRELSARVKAVLRRYSPPSTVSNTSQTGLFFIDENKQQIRYRNQTLDCSRIEFRLLSLLIKTPGHVYSREQLMDHAWDHAAYSLDRTVDTHIKTLRQKLKSIAPDLDPIETHRGIGYSLKTHV